MYHKLVESGCCDYKRAHIPCVAKEMVCRRRRKSLISACVGLVCGIAAASFFIGVAVSVLWVFFVKCF
jgi:hypothetical protein